MTVRKPTAIKLREGTYREDRAVKNEFTPTLERNFQPPPDLNEWGTKLWNQICEEYANHSLITIVDNGSLFALCNEFGRYCEANDLVQAQGLQVEIPVFNNKGEQTGSKIDVNPMIKVVSDAFKNYRAMALEFGLTPASRTKIAAPTKVDNDPFADY